MTTHLDCDIVVIGGGLVGAAFALAAARSGRHVTLLEGREPHAPAVDGWDSRIYAISRASQTLLAEVGAWQRAPAERIQPVSAMDVRGDGAGQLQFSALDSGLSELTWIVESGQLQWALWRQLQDSSVDIVAPARPVAVTWEVQHAAVQLEDGRTLRAQLLVGADGAQSWLRQQASIATTAQPYGQKGVVANFSCTQPHLGVARQWFRRDGILAWLPLPGNRISIVWSCFDAEADRLTALPPKQLAAEVMAAGGAALGDLQCITPAAAFPLRLLHVHELVRPRLALIGDAGHNVHPLAGQGVNLGFEDARDLAAVLANAQAAGRRDAGDYLTLRRFERKRREDIYAMQAVTHSLQKLFNNDNALLGSLRNWGLSLTNRLPLIKRQLIRQALA